MSLVDINFSAEFPLSPLHWIIADKTASITVESVRGGLTVYDNPWGVLTNNPTFDVQSFRLNDYRTCRTGSRRIPSRPDVPLDLYSRGMGGLGLPATSRRRRDSWKAVFTRMNSVCGTSESEVAQPVLPDSRLGRAAEGVRPVGDEEKYEITIYSSCLHADKGIYYYTTYENSQITGVDMHREDLDGAELVAYPLVAGQQIAMQN